MNIILKNDSDETLYEQIVFQMKNLIINKQLIAGDLISSIRGLAKELNVSVITVKKAYEELENIGYIRSIAGKGYYVSANNVENMRDIAMSKIENDLEKLVIMCKAINVSKIELFDIIEVIYDDK